MVARGVSYYIWVLKELKSDGHWQVWCTVRVAKLRAGGTLGRTERIIKESSFLSDMLELF